MCGGVSITADFLYRGLAKLEHNPKGSKRYKSWRRAVGKAVMFYLVGFVLILSNFAVLEAKTPLVIGKLHNDQVFFFIVSLFPIRMMFFFRSRSAKLY